jgi:CheY-like chemotaxis protein
VKSGNNVKTVDNGADAIKLINSESFDLVLCDLAMPNIFGYDVIKVLNDLEKRPKIGIITGWLEQLKPIDEEGLAVDFILTKPFNLSALSKYINDIFGADSR